MHKFQISTSDSITARGRIMFVHHSIEHPPGGMTSSNKNYKVKAQIKFHARGAGGITASPEAGTVVSGAGAVGGMVELGSA